MPSLLSLAACPAEGPERSEWERCRRERSEGRRGGGIGGLPIRSSDLSREVRRTKWEGAKEGGDHLVTLISSTLSAPGAATVRRPLVSSMIV